MVINGEKYCGACCQWLEVLQFNKDRHRSDGYRSECRNCQVASNRIQYDKVRVRGDRYNRNILSDSNVDKILEMLGDGHSGENVAKFFGVSTGTISSIRHKGWQ